jgi:acyl carrier protein
LFWSVLPQAPRDEYLEVEPGRDVNCLSDLRSKRFDQCVGVDFSSAIIAMTERLLECGRFAVARQSTAGGGRVSDRLTVIIAAVLDLDPSEIRDDASAESLVQWDSVKQIDLMLAVEDEFNVRFRDDQIGILTSHRSIREALTGLGVPLLSDVHP